MSMLYIYIVYVQLKLSTLRHLFKSNLSINNNEVIQLSIIILIILGSIAKYILNLKLLLLTISIMNNMILR